MFSQTVLQMQNNLETCYTLFS